VFRAVAAALLVSAIDCSPGAVEWGRFNASTDELQVGLISDGPQGPAVDTVLHSTTGAVDVGTANVDPGTGPLGTRHLVSVHVADEWMDVVDRVSVWIDAGPRGREEFELVRDSADHGYWQLEVESSGEPGESRTDTFSVRLWQVVANGAATDSGA